MKPVMKISDIVVHGNSEWEVKIYEFKVVLKYTSDGGQCHLHVRTADKDLFDGFMSMSVEYRQRFARAFVMKELEPGKLTMCIYEGSSQVSLQCPWKGNEAVFLLVTVAIHDRFQNRQPAHVDIHLSVADYSLSLAAV